jgi:MFS family permease
LLLRFAAIFGASVSFYLLLSVVPLYAMASGGGGGVAGLATGALLFATVAGELTAPRLARRYGYRVTVAAGLFLLGAPALVLVFHVGIALVMVVCAVRGVGFATLEVAAGSLVASLIPAERRGEGLALAGVVSSVPAVAALPLGVWLCGRVGYGPVFAAGAVAALAALVVVPWLPGRDSARRRPAGEPGPAESGAGAHGKPLGIFAGLRTGALLRPAAAFAATTTAAGVLVTFVPLAVTQASGSVAALALLAQPAATTLARWLAGRHGDRRGPARQLVPGLVASAAGIAMIALTGVPVAVVAGSLIFGAGFGFAQNATQAMMFERVPASGYPTVSALWNLAYDLGMGVGAAGFGLLAAGTGYPVAFCLIAAVVLTALVPARRDRKLTG